MALSPTLTLVDASIASLEHRIGALILSQRDKLEIARWLLKNRQQLARQLTELGELYHLRSSQCARMRHKANTDEEHPRLLPVPPFPLENVRVKQVTQIRECLGWEWEDPFMNLNEAPLQPKKVLESKLAYGMMEGYLTAHRLVGALVLLTSLVAGVEAERIALMGSCFLPNGTWDKDRVEMKVVLESLAQME
ncbi:MAG: hypothetical protein Q9195_006456 [Heterodermia aff. obscurata]